LTIYDTMAYNVRSTRDLVYCAAIICRDDSLRFSLCDG